MEALAKADEHAFVQAAPVEVDPIVATKVRECRVLSPAEVAELVEAYRRGAFTRELARQYGMHRHTVDRHLDRAGVVKRPVVKMTAAKISRAKDLYAQGWSTQRIGRELEVSQGAVYKALKRAGVRMRRPVA
jgi:DNA invertase Pin-like site-specific DNA recombinase